MPITQERLTSLIAVSRYFKSTLDRSREAVLGYCGQESLPPEVRLELIYAELSTLVTPEHIMQTLLEEEAHHKARRGTQQAKQRYEQRRRDTAAGIVPRANILPARQARLDAEITIHNTIPPEAFRAPQARPMSDEELSQAIGRDMNHRSEVERALAENKVLMDKAREKMMERAKEEAKEKADRADADLARLQALADADNDESEALVESFFPTKPPTQPEG